MADTAYQTVYRDEWIAAYERNQSLLRSTVTTAANIRGEKATFLVSNSNREAVTRGSNGLIPAAVGAQTPTDVVLEEWHDLPQKTNFDILRAQANQRAIMIAESQAVINRKVDDLIIDSLATGTIDTGASATVMTKSLFGMAMTTLFNSKIPNDGQIYALLTPAAWEYLTDDPMFSSKDYVDARPMANGPATGLQWLRWKGALIMMHTGLPGVGTAAAKCFIYHKSAVGHAYAAESLRPVTGYNEEQDYYYVRSSIYMGSALLQNAGVVVINHDDSALIGS